MPEPVFRMTPRAVESCVNCPLNGAQGVLRQVTTEVHGADVLFIAEAPGGSENEVGRPIVGKTGQILRRLVAQLAGEHKVAYSNVVRCRPCLKGDVTKDRKPTAQEIAICRVNILADIDRFNPKQIVICGDAAAKGLARRLDGNPINPKASISSIRGHDFTITSAAGKVFPATITYHYSYVSYTPNVAQVFRDDVTKAFMRARGDVEDYSERGKAVLLDTIEKVRRFKAKVDALTQDDILVLDYETETKYRLNNRILCAGFAFEANRGFVIPLKHPESPWTAEEYQEVETILKEILGAKQTPYALVAHNFAFEQHITLDNYGIRLSMPMDDTMLRAHALNPDRTKAAKEKDDDEDSIKEKKDKVEDGPFALKTLVKEWLGFYHYDDSDIAPIVELRNQGLLLQAPLRGLAEYNAMDCYTTYRLYQYEQVRAKLDKYDTTLTRLGRVMHKAVVTSLVEMERNGLRMDKEYIQDLMADDAKVATRLREIEKEFYALDSVQEANRLLVAQKLNAAEGLWGQKRDTWLFDLNKPDSKRILYFDVLELAPVKISTKTKLPSVGRALFDQYIGIPEIDLFAEWSILYKLQGTYLKGVYASLQSDPDMRDGRVRTHYRAHGTITGRISSSNPNVLNVPKKGEEGKKNASASLIKKMYICDPGHAMIIADYSQAEVRWLAELTQDPDLLRAFQAVWDIRAACLKNPTASAIKMLDEEGDFHKQTAAMIFGISVSQVTRAQRNSSKAIVFGLIYGMSVAGLAARLKVSKKEAEEFIKKFFARFPKAEAALKRMEEDGFNNGFVESPTGRRKGTASSLIIGDIKNLAYEFQHLKAHKAYEDRISRNMPVQGIASDMNLLACHAILRYKEKHNLHWRLINSVYDSIMLEVPWLEVTHCIEKVQQIMESPKLFKPFDFEPKVRFFADMSVGIDWAEQLDITAGGQGWKVTCSVCKKYRDEAAPPTEKRCWECGAKTVKRSLEKGPLDMILNYIDKQHNLAQFWT